jgi:hypothetical protein
LSFYAGGVRPEYVNQGYWNPRRYLVTSSRGVKTPDVYSGAPLSLTSRANNQFMDFSGGRGFIGGLQPGGNAGNGPVANNQPLSFYAGAMQNL